MHNIFEADETDAVLLVDASNAFSFNSLNRAAALNNNRVLCPLIATYVTSTYRVPARLFVIALVVVSLNLQKELHRETP